jgi:hypothetical protein
MSTAAPATNFRLSEQKFKWPTDAFTDASRHGVTKLACGGFLLSFQDDAVTDVVRPSP